MVAGRPFDPVSVFYSYSHADEQMRDVIDKQLATLRRLGLVETWHDRRIGAGQEWNKEIDAKLRSADIILLLLSPDFISSDYCYGIEATAALERHKRDEATVIPIVLRAVDFKGLPFADLQSLPQDGRPIFFQQTPSGPRYHEDRLLEIEQGIRAAVENIAPRRLRKHGSAHTHSTVLEPRAIDAAIAQQISVGEFRDVVVQIRLERSDGLRGVLLPDFTSDVRRPEYSSNPGDIRSEVFDAAYSVTTDNELISPQYRLLINAPSMLIGTAEKHFPLRHMRDSSVFTFLVKAETEGEHRLLINLESSGWTVSEALLQTSATAFRPSPGGKALAAGVVASVQLVVRAIAKAATLSA